MIGPRSNRPLTQGLPPAIAERWRAQFPASSAGQAPASSAGQALRGHGPHRLWRWMEAEILYAPLSEDGANVSMLAFAATVPKPG